MTVRRDGSDPRGTGQRTADEEALRTFEAGEILQVDPDAERDAMEQVQRRYRLRRELAATLGKELGVLRRAHGLTQEQVARAVGTKKSNVSRLESGRYGGLTVERFIAVLEAFQALGRPELESRRLARPCPAPRAGSKRLAAARDTPSRSGDSRATR